MNSAVESSESGMELRDLLLDEEFPRRQRSRREAISEGDALLRLARVFADRPDTILEELLDVAVELCGADSAGISLEEKTADGELRFRWIAVSGSLAEYVDGLTPRVFSPCGTCLNTGRPQLYRVSRLYYEFLGITAEPITDGILIPWANEEMRGTLWAVSHGSTETFDMEDYRLLSRLAEFASMAVRHESQESNVRRQERSLASAEKANEMAHLINNPLQSLTNTIYLAQQGGDETQAYLRKACAELTSLSEIVKKLLA